MENEIIPASELVLNDDGSVYHLHLLPEDLADTIIFVGDQDRVPEISMHFDHIEVKKSKREFVTHTGTIGSKRLSVISTGIGTDNIDIVMNELDALVNVDLRSREIRHDRKSLRIIRIGTSGALQADIETGSVLISSHGLGLDSLMQFYDYEETPAIADLVDAIDDQLDLLFVSPYLFEAPGSLASDFAKLFSTGITATCCGFYGPQGRTLRGPTKYEDLVNRLSRVELPGHRITNFEMETAGIYGLASLFGHEAVSVNAILANRISHQFAKDPAGVMAKTIRDTLDLLI